MFSSTATAVILLSIVLGLAHIVSADPSICRSFVRQTIVFLFMQQLTIFLVLSLGGGGDRGAYQAGAYKALVELSKNKEDVQYDLISGISVGSINTAALTQFKKGDEEAAKNFIIPLWKSTKASDVWKNWFVTIFKPQNKTSSYFFVGFLEELLKDFY